MIAPQFTTFRMTNEGFYVIFNAFVYKKIVLLLTPMRFLGRAMVFTSNAYAFTINCYAFVLNVYAFVINSCAYVLNVNAFVINSCAFVLNVDAFVINTKLVVASRRDLFHPFLMLQISSNYP